MCLFCFSHYYDYCVIFLVTEGAHFFPPGKKKLLKIKLVRFKGCRATGVTLALPTCGVSCWRTNRSPLACSRVCFPCMPFADNTEVHEQ